RTADRVSGAAALSVGARTGAVALGQQSAGKARQSGALFSDAKRRWKARTAVARDPAGTDAVHGPVRDGGLGHGPKQAGSRLLVLLMAARGIRYRIEPIPNEFRGFRWAPLLAC